MTGVAGRELPDPPAARERWVALLKPLVLVEGLWSTG